MELKRSLLPESDLPVEWYNLLADLPEPLPPPIHPLTKEPLDPAALERIFAKELIRQEVSQERWIGIPDEVRRVYALWRPTPLVRARNLEKALKTPARIYFKDESHSPPGSHKPNTAVAQAYYNKIQGIRRLSTETGAGQWGSSLAFACSFFGLECKVYMVKVSYHQKPYRRVMMQLWGATVTPSPSEETECGRKILASDPNCPGSLGIAISEAVEVALKNDDTNYTLGSVLNHVMLHQTVIGLEAEKQMKEFGDWPDVVIGCVGGGSNFAGLAFPFLRHKLAGKEMRFVAAEPKACPSLTRGMYRYDFGDTSMLTPLLKMHTLGHSFVPAGIHAGGLRYHGMAPMVSFAVKLGLVEAVALHQRECFEAARLFAATEGIIPAPETSHAIRAAIIEALKCKETGEEKCILFNLSGHGICDLGAYERYLAGELEDYELPQEQIDQALAELPAVE
ncbi:Tryptophan synthase beta chain like [Thermogutta terrifontis]|jgi:tryptophan synthase beta chain|uniref:Tryptophan synthase beta chain n=1 Tax=Thermogutta terrifontis TaxID=1331910 RepID=A0A286RHH6_9BACT|nr:TrpB-like pyridoxal phosphate-dependent enzyme [Thermogutta terrifontis]ASV75425.1 Tryptophan synthase beta chain like [Thermogutta terrifontis]